MNFIRRVHGKLFSSTGFDSTGVAKIFGLEEECRREQLLNTPVNIRSTIPKGNYRANDAYVVVVPEEEELPVGYIRPSITENENQLRAFSFKEILKKRITKALKSDHWMMAGTGVAFSHKHGMVFVAVECAIYLFSMDTLEYVNLMEGTGIEDIEIVSNYDGLGGDGLLVACGYEYPDCGLKLFDVKQIMLMINNTNANNAKLDEIASVFHIKAGFTAVGIKNETDQNKNNNGRGPLIFASHCYNGYTKLLILNTKGEIQKEFMHGDISGIAVIDDCVIVTDFVLGVASVLQEQNDNGQLDNYVHISTEKFVCIRGPICVDPISKSIFISEVERSIHKISVFNLKKGKLVFSKQLKLPEGSGNVISRMGSSSEYKIFALDYDPYSGRLWISESEKEFNTNGNIVILE